MLVGYDDRTLRLAVFRKPTCNGYYTIAIQTLEYIIICIVYFRTKMPKTKMQRRGRPRRKRVNQVSRDYFGYGAIHIGLIFTKNNEVILFSVNIGDIVRHYILHFVQHIVPHNPAVLHYVQLDVGWRLMAQVRVYLRAAPVADPS